VISAAPGGTPVPEDYKRNRGPRRFVHSPNRRRDSARYRVPGLTVRLRLAVLLPIVAVLTTVAVAHALAADGKAGRAALTPTKLEQGKQLYRKYCGQCHALTQALAAGFGSDKGLGTDGGPSFNNLRVPYNLSIVAVTEQFGGHELVVKRMTWDQLDQVAAFTAIATKNNPYLARISDG
jgi:mono/diheme cytochrome c family protein